MIDYLALADSFESEFGEMPRLFSFRWHPFAVERGVVALSGAPEAEPMGALR